MHIGVFAGFRLRPVFYWTGLCFVGNGLYFVRKINNMKITVKKDHAGIDLIYEAENVKIVESIEERTYSKKENGSPDFKFAPKRDVLSTAIDQFSSILEDLVYYRQADYDSSKLIDILFEKLPEEEVSRLLFLLTKKYDYANV